MTTINRNNDKRITLSLGNEGLQLFLIALLNEWGFTVSTTYPQSPDDLVLTEENNRKFADHPKRVHLTSSTSPETDQVTLPINPEQLWRVLEKHYHRPPRHHLRLIVDYPVTMEVRGQSHPGELKSLSPAGARLTLPRELAMGEIIPIDLPLREETLHLLGKIIYVTTFPDSLNQYDAGVLFERISTEEKALLRDNILETFFNHIRGNLPGWAFEVGINSFDLSPELRNRL